MDKQNEQEMFEHYVVNDDYNRRERTYFTHYFIAFVAYLCIVGACYMNFPTKSLGGVPIICLIVWVTIIAHYFYFTVYRGKKLYDLEGEKELGLEE